jgi:uncharacterized protein (UPF0276 family)
VGVAYHPFLHDYLLERSALFDFVELPLDLYLDPARAALLDPGQCRLRQVVSRKRCVWRGTALSLGTVDPSSNVGFAPHLLHRIRELLQQTDAAHYTDVIGFKVPKFGASYALPFTRTAARWVAERQEAASEALGAQVQLALPDAAIPAPWAELDAAGFLTVAASFGASGFVLDTAALGLASPQDGVIAGLPAEQVTAISVSSDDAAAWDMAAHVAGHVRPGTIILRRDRQLFPLDTIERDLRRAAQLIALPAAIQVATSSLVPQADWDDQEGLAALHDYQASMARAAQDGGDGAASAWRNWRTQVDDMHKAQQIMALTARNDGRHLPRPPS